LIPFWYPVKIRLSVIWQYRGFILNLVGREFRSKYMGSLLGSMWSIIKPLAMILIYTVIFSKIIRARLPGVDDTMGYGIFLCSGLLTWGFFAELLERSLNVFLENANLIKKVHFPRITLPVGLCLTTAINFLIVFGIFLLFLIISGRSPGWSILGCIPILLLQQSLALGLGMLLATFNIFFRDIGHFISIVLQFWFWGTPIVYPLAILPEKIQGIVRLNPMTHIIVTYQKIALHHDWPHWFEYRYHAVGALICLIAGYKVFQQLSAEIVDEL